MEAPVIVKPIPAQVVNEHAAYGPFHLSDYIATPDQSAFRFSAELSTGESLPKGMICTEDGVLTGIPASDTHGNYEIKLTAENEAGYVETTFVLTIKPSLGGNPTAYMDQIKAQVWEALDQNMPLPDLGDILNRPITAMDVYYLLERWAMLTIWNAFNLEPAGEKVLLNLPDASPHYHVYDRGSCLIATPKDLFSHERTLEDSLQTARAMAREIYRRGWSIEFAGFDKMTRAAWVEVQQLMDKHGKKIEIINYYPSPEDIKIYSIQLNASPTPGMDT